MANEDEPAAAGESQRGTALPKGGQPPAKDAAEQPAGDIQTYISSRLRQAYDDIASQPVPDRFLALMRDLDKA